LAATTSKARGCQVHHRKSQAQQSGRAARQAVVWPGIASSVRDDLKKAGVNVALFEGINAGDSDYSAVITKLKSAGVDFVYYGGYHPEMGLLLRQAGEQGLKTRFMGPEGVGNPEVNAIAGPAVEGMLLTLPADFASNPKNAAIVKAFKDNKRDLRAPSSCRRTPPHKCCSTASRPWATMPRWLTTCTKPALTPPSALLAGTKRAT
jgi:hypothetical protein